ncbi:MAG: hypothetical protein NC115_12160 [Bacteroidales bacterium]|nr:hypothetical protein [Bacteroidales bacterium]
MIYLNNTTEEQLVFVPRNYRTDATRDYRLVLYSTVDHVETAVALSGVEVAGDYLSCNMTLPDEMAEGEYQYLLTGDGEELSTGLAVISWKEMKNKQYMEVIQYEQYDGQ